MNNSLTPVRVRHHLSREEDGNVREQNSARNSLAAESAHVSVMRKEVLEFLRVKKGDIVVDATFGAGGHSRAIETSAAVTLIAIDADPVVAQQHPKVITANFGDLDSVLQNHLPDGGHIDKALFDLGWNREQLSAGRGFSFITNEPLLMTYGVKPVSGFTAAQIVNTWSEKVLADVFFGYGEERYARRIAKAILERRKQQPISTTIELVEIVRDAVPSSYRHGRLHPATRTFQALRIAVNDELTSIERGIAAAWKYLSCGGRIALITFHSVEDRLVKKTFANLVKVPNVTKAGRSCGRLVVKKPIIPSRAEILQNPSSRSAKLRVIEKICQEI